jgi:hypothetical protein
MGNSTVTLLSVVDLMKTTGSASVAQAAGGYSSLTWLAIANDVINDLVSERFNWKWNAFRVPSFVTNSYQNDYASISQFGIGWLEDGTWTDINNTSLPKPRLPLKTVRQLALTSACGSPPQKACWVRNAVLEQGVWPGAGMLYVNPLGATTNPNNPKTNILDAAGNILVLTTFGTTGVIAPVAVSSAAAGVTVADGTCVWTVADPSAQGIRLTPMPPQTGVAYQIDLVAQASPPRLTLLSQFINPIPDDDASNFIAGVYVYCHKYNPDPMVKRLYPQLHQEWLADILHTLQQDDREGDDAGFVPTRNVMGNGSSGDVGPANPYGSNWPGR